MKELEPPRRRENATADTAKVKDVSIPSRMTNLSPEQLRENRVNNSTRYQQDRRKAGLPPRYM